MTIDYILASGVAKESATALAKRLGCRISFRPLSGRYIRYGSLQAAAGPCLNRLDAVRLAANKLGALLTLHDAGLPVPRLQTYEEHEPRPWPRMLRKLKRHAGNDSPRIVPPGELPNLDGFDYSLEFVAKTAEYRVHVCLGEVIRTQQRQPRGRGARHASVWSLQNGWALADIEPAAGYLAWIAAKSVAVLGLDFGTVDIAQTKWGFFVLEVNTAPGILPHGVALYADAFRKWR